MCARLSTKVCAQLVFPAGAGKDDRRVPSQIDPVATEAVKKIIWTRILLKLRKFAGWEGGSREVQGAIDSTRPRLKFQRLPPRINRSRQLTAEARVPRIGPGIQKWGGALNLSHLEPLDCPLPNLQIFLACVISGIRSCDS